jgi:hypothetical protein
VTVDNGNDDLQETGQEGLDCLNVAQHGDREWAVVNTATNLQELLAKY